MQIEVVGQNWRATDQPARRSIHAFMYLTVRPICAAHGTNWNCTPPLRPRRAADGFDQLIEPGKALLIPNGDVAALREEALAMLSDAGRT